MEPAEANQRGAGHPPAAAENTQPCRSISGRGRPSLHIPTSPVPAMDDIPSLSSGDVGSRFVSQSEIDTAKAKRDEQWKVRHLLSTLNDRP
jgi:hypothetical protein